VFFRVLALLLVVLVRRLLLRLRLLYLVLVQR
jgi:hypothetical protein